MDTERFAEAVADELTLQEWVDSVEILKGEGAAGPGITIGVVDINEDSHFITIEAA